MSVPTQRIKSREQIITSRRIVFRRNLNCYESESNFATSTSIQQVRQLKLKPTLESNNKLCSTSNNPQQWSRCKSKKTPSEMQNDEMLKAVGDGHFQAYQNGNLSKFLNETTTKRVSDVCLVNDNFILVKIPQKSKEIVCLKENSIKKTSIYDNSCTQIENNSNNNKSRRLVPKMYHKKRVQPITSNADNVMKISPTVPPNLRHIHWRNVVDEDIDESKIKMVRPVRQDSPNTFCCSNFPTSLHDSVEMKHQGAVVYMDEEDNMENWKKVQHVESPPHQKRTKIFDVFHWIFNRFCVSLKCRKRPKKIQAVVYKTYFVRWSKQKSCYNNENQSRFSGKKCTDIRRINSALF